MRRWIAVALGIAVSAILASGDGPEVLELELRLVGALGESGSLTMGLARTGDRWERVWAGGTESRKIRLFTGRVAKAEVSQNRVMLPEDDTAADACGRVTHVETRPDGSGILSIDLNDVYSGKVDAFGGLYSKHGNLRHDRACEDIGIRALRGRWRPASASSAHLVEPRLTFALRGSIGGGRIRFGRGGL